MKNVHLVIADLFLPAEFAVEVCAELRLPALEKILSRGIASDAQSSLEVLLCGLFNVPCYRGAPVAAISATFDGLGEGNWLRADPVHVRLQREQVVLLPVTVSIEESVQLCASLNAHFADQGVAFFAPHPDRWYVRVDELPDIATMPISQIAGRNIHGHLPTGPDASVWHQLFNEIQMLLFAHPLNEAREARGEAPINSVWFWGEGEAGGAQSSYDRVHSDLVLAQMLASAAGKPFSEWNEHVCNEPGTLLVWTGLRRALQKGDLAGWRSALQAFEISHAQPLWQALRRGQITQLSVDIAGADCIRQSTLTRSDAWSFWRRNKKLAGYSPVPSQV